MPSLSYRFTFPLFDHAVPKVTYVRQYRPTKGALWVQSFSVIFKLCRAVDRVGALPSVIRLLRMASIKRGITWLIRPPE